MANEPHRGIVAGIGNVDRGDDAAGRAVASRLQGRVPGGVAVLELDGEATTLIARLAGAPGAIIVDACRSGAPAGTVCRFDVSAAPLPAAGYGLSTHGFGLASAIELARALGQLPHRCVVYAIEGERFDAGAELSPAVEAAIDGVVSQILAELDGGGRTI